MKNIILALALVGSMSSFAQAEESVTCKLYDLKNKSVGVTLTLSESGEGGVESDGALDIGRYNYNFIMDLENKGNQYTVGIVFYENNRVQDEVSSMSCEFEKGGETRVICEEPIQDFNGKLISNLVCTYQTGSI